MYIVVVSVNCLLVDVPVELCRMTMDLSVKFLLVFLLNVSLVLCSTTIIRGLPPSSKHDKLTVCFVSPVNSRFVVLSPASIGVPFLSQVCPTTILVLSIPLLV